MKPLPKFIEDIEPIGLLRGLLKERPYLTVRDIEAVLQCHRTSVYQLMDRFGDEVCAGWIKGKNGRRCRAWRWAK